MIEIQQIVISYFRLGKSERQIAKELGIHRRTVHRYIDLYKADQSNSITEQQGVIVPPAYDSSKRGQIKFTVTIQEFIDSCLAKNAEKDRTGLHKQKMRNVDIHEALKTAGHSIGYTTVCNYVRSQKKIKREKFIKQHYHPGSLVEFDWGWVKLWINDQLLRLKMAVFTSAYSNHRYAMLFIREDMCSFLEAHTHYLSAIGGVPFCFLYDNMKVAVAKFALRQSDKKPTNDLLKISNYYQFDYRFANAGKGNEKGHVERSVEYVRRRSFSFNDRFESIAQANQYLLEKVDQLNKKASKGKTETIQELFEQEQKLFKKLPVSIYQTALISTRKLDKYNTICVDTNHYSVPETIQGNSVEVKIYSNRVIVYDLKSNQIAIHPRRYSKYQWYIDIDHYLFTLKTKPGALACSYALKQAPQVLKNLFENHYKDKPKIFIEIALYCKNNGIEIDHWQEATEKYKEQTPNEITAEIIIYMIQQIKNGQRDEQQPVQEKSKLSEHISHSAKQQLIQIQNIFN